MTVAYRRAEPRDRDWIIGNWETSLQDAHTAGPIPMEMWAGVMRPICAYYLDRPYVRTFVAYNPDAEPGTADLHGFIIGEPDEKPPIVYYVLTEQSMRHFGIARRLFASLGVDPKKPFFYLCSTPILAPNRSEHGSSLFTKIPLAKWKPNIARYSRGPHRDRARETRKA